MPKKGNVAVITGASSGMGREFAIQIAQNYPSIQEFWIIARRKDRLEQLQQKISEMEAYRYSRRSFLECIRELSNTVKKRDVNLAKKALKEISSC